MYTPPLSFERGFGMSCLSDSENFPWIILHLSPYVQLPLCVLKGQTRAARTSCLVLKLCTLLFSSATKDTHGIAVSSPFTSVTFHSQGAALGCCGLFCGSLVPKYSAAEIGWLSSSSSAKKPIGKVPSASYALGPIKSPAVSLTTGAAWNLLPG